MWANENVSFTDYASGTVASRSLQISHKFEKMIMTIYRLDVIAKFFDVTLFQGYSFYRF